MYAPILEIDTRKIEENARKLHTFCALRGVELAFVTKGFSARPGVIRAARVMWAMMSSRVIVRWSGPAASPASRTAA